MRTYLQLLAIMMPIVWLMGCSTTGKTSGESDSSSPTVVDPGPVVQVVTDSPSDSGTELGGGRTGGGGDFRPLPGGGQGGFSGGGLGGGDDLLSKRVIYFDYDSSVIKDQARDIIRAHAEYLAQNSRVSITLEGHCDERGTREYNLALGERRANAVRDLLLVMGASRSQIRTTSFGEERPVAFGHDESSWSQNRRAQFVYANNP